MNFRCGCKPPGFLAFLAKRVCLDEAVADSSLCSLVSLVILEVAMVAVVDSALALFVNKTKLPAILSKLGVARCSAWAFGFVWHGDSTF